MNNLLANIGIAILLALSPIVLVYFWLMAANYIYQYTVIGGSLFFGLIVPAILGLAAFIASLMERIAK